MGGCTASKLDNEDTVRRCKERRRLMKEAVLARHHLSAAHSDYLRSLRLTGSALFDFASGEPLCVSDQTPAVLLRNPSSSSTTTTTTSSRIPHFQKSTPPPPPPRQPSLSSFSQSPVRAPPPPLARSQIYSASESTPSYRKPSNKKFDYPTANSTYSETPSQASSAWNWENFYPPSPPGSDFFRRPNDDDRTSSHHLPDDHHSQIDKDEEDEYEDEETEREETEREEVHCSEWGDHYSTTSSDTKSDNEDLESRSEIGSRSNFGSSVHNDVASKSNRQSMGFGKLDNKSDDAGSSVSWNIGDTIGGGGGGGDEISDMKLVVRHRDLAEIAASIKDYFEKAADAGAPVSDLLEITRAQLDRSFRQLKKTVSHSNSILTNLSSSFTSKPPLEIKYRLDASALNEPGPKSHCSTLEQLLAWEKKLYQEVKAREGANIEHEKKLSSLQTQEYRGGAEAKLDKTKASLKRLQSLIVVTSQAVSTTSSAIIRVRDTELTPQLIELCHGLMYMWRSMNQFHELQNHIVQQVRGLINRAAKGESTNDLHRQATRHLESAVSSWHSNFCRLIKFQRDYIRSLHSWLRLTQIPIKDIITTEPTTNLSEVFGFLDEWKQALDRLPDTVASESIKSFVNVVHVISTKQSEELKIKKRGEVAVKELEKKATSLRNIEKKFYQSYSMVGIALPDGGRSSDGGGQVFDARDPLAEKKLELAASQRKVEEEMSKYAKAVDVTRSMTLNNIQTGLPGVFQAMTMFSGLFNEALLGVCNRSYSIK